MDSVTQQNAAQTEELSSTAQALAAQAEELQGQVAKFTLATESREPRVESLAPSRKVVPLKAKGKGKTGVPKPIAVKATGTEDAHGTFEEF